MKFDLLLMIRSVREGNGTAVVDGAIKKSSLPLLLQLGAVTMGKWVHS